MELRGPVWGPCTNFLYKLRYKFNARSTKWQISFTHRGKETLVITIVFFRQVLSCPGMAKTAPASHCLSLTADESGGRHTGLLRLRGYRHPSRSSCEFPVFCCGIKLDL